MSSGREVIVYSQHSTFYPMLGKERDLLAHLEQWAKELQAQGIVISILHQLFNPAGPSFVSVIHYQDLGEFESRRRQWQADPRFQAQLATAVALSRTAPTTQLFEVPVPFPG